MKTKISAKDILAPTLVLLVICAVSAVLLGATNMLTEEKIASADSQARQQAMQTVMPDADSFSQSVAAGDSLEYSEALADGEVIGYAFTVTENGYGGKITVSVGIRLDGTVNKVEVISADNETPGLGQNIKKESFLDGFIGKLGEITAVKGAPSGENEIQAITSATISSSAVARAVSAASEYAVENLCEGGGGNG